MTHSICKWIVILGLFILSPLTFAEYVVIVNPANGSQIRAEDIERIFLAKVKTFPGGQAATPVNQKPEAPVRRKFEDDVIGKNEGQMRAYWSQLIFTGKATPLKQFDSDADVIKFVSENADAIGYVDSASVTASVKVVHKY